MPSLYSKAVKMSFDDIPFDSTEEHLAQLIHGTQPRKGGVLAWNLLARWSDFYPFIGFYFYRYGTGKQSAARSVDIPKETKAMYTASGQDHQGATHHPCTPPNQTFRTVTTDITK